ncbi:hypothetical protein BD779DRAFT_225500 [Infundibulicybe gibba]|nr:hypothetical protein BD779DRAFT_225500 [Infundibulicybe gibba]
MRLSTLISGLISEHSTPSRLTPAGSDRNQSSNMLGTYQKNNLHHTTPKDSHLEREEGLMAQGVVGIGSELSVGTGLQPCTSTAQLIAPFELDGRCVVLIDTPSFGDTKKSGIDALRMISASLATT